MPRADALFCEQARAEGARYPGVPSGCGCHFAPPSARPKAAPRMRMRRGARAIARMPALGARAALLLYRYTLSPLVGYHCRHLPTCSDYADQSFARFGFWAGGWMTLARLLRCHPWGSSGLDFPADALPPHSRWYMPWRYGRWRGTHAGTLASGSGASGAMASGAMASGAPASGAPASDRPPKA